MTIRFATTIASMTLAMSTGFAVSSANAQNPQPGSPQVTSDSGSAQSLPPGSAVTLTLNLGNNLGNGQTLNPNAVSIEIIDEEGNILITPEPTITSVGNPATSTNFTWKWVVPGYPNTTYTIIYSGTTNQGKTFSGAIGIGVGPPT